MSAEKSPPPLADGAGGEAVAPYQLYDEVAEAASALVIKRYSSSFGIASRLLAEPVRTDVRNVYALVRIADEIVDAPRPGGRRAVQAGLLDGLESDTQAAIRTGHSANPVVHAFALTARRCGIGADLIAPFFASMRTDLFRHEHDQDSFDDYVYGSAEVVGLMCLRAFLRGRPEASTEYDALSPGARRLGAAFQKVNFLRDLASDSRELGRCYFPGLDLRSFDEADRDRLLDDIDADLAAAAAVIPRLPRTSRRAVCAAHALFEDLSRRLRSTAPEELLTRRVRVPTAAKARIVARSITRGVA